MIYEFKSSTIPPLKQIGGKAKGLMESTHAGLPVPEGLVLSVDFFQEWLDEVKSSKAWANFLENTTKEECELIAETIGKLRFTPRQKDKLSEHLLNLPGNVFSTRSSSPEEDLEGTSFAGMYETYLGVSREDVEAFVLKTFASCFDYRVMGYKKQNNIPLENTAIAVVIQRQIQSDVSGVAFSLNPLNNAYDEVVINASFGLGEAIVSGMVTPDTYVVDKVSSIILDSKVNRKDIAIRLTNEGEITKEKNTNPDAKALTDEQIIELSDLACRVEEYNGKPMDTEWAIEAGSLFLLQARPITTHIPLFPEMLTEPGKNKELYMDFLLVTQGFSESMSTLGIDIWAKMVHIGNGLPRGKDGILWAIHGRHYMSMSHLMRVSPAMLKTFSSHDEPTKRIFSDLDESQFTHGKTPGKLKGFLWKTVKHMVPLYAGSALEGVFNSQAALEDYQEASQQVSDFMYKELGISDKPFSVLVDQALDGFAELIKEVGGVLTAASLAKWEIERLFRKREETKDLIVSLAMNLPNNPVAEMSKLMLIVASSPEFIATETSDEFEHRLENKGYTPEFTALYEEYIHRFGCRGVKEIDIATPRLSENISHIFDALKQIDVHDNAALHVQKRSDEAYEQLHRIAKDIGKEKKFVKLAKTYRDTMGYRDHPKYMYVVAVGLLRQKALQLGEQWVASGRLEQPEQIFNLSVEQLAQAENDQSLEILPLVKENIAPYEAVAQVKDWPRIIDSRGKIYRAFPDAKEGEIAGQAISPGLIKGRAKVLLDPYEKTINKGEILVCKASEPSWAPIFINASGVVMEVGGPLQHGAIIAREYGLPCVSSVYNATSIIKDGDLIEVDGSNGIVRVIDE